MGTKMLESLTTRKRWTAYLACVGGCLDYLGMDVSDGWLWGGTGHAFMLNIHPVLCPSGPTAWDCKMLFELADNLGYDVRGVFADRGHEGDAYVVKQREAWDLACAAIDDGLPCFGWEVRPYIPDYLLINGHDDVGYYYTGYQTGGPTPWDELGTHDVQILQVYAVEPTAAPASPQKVVKDALTEVLRVAENSAGVIFPDYRFGPAGFTLWAQALEKGEALYEGNVYNGQVWGECRELAVAFLDEAREKLAPAPGSALDKALIGAAAAYAVVRDRIKALLAMHPERPLKEQDWKMPLHSTEGAALMREAAAAEAQGIAALQGIVAAL
jgi:hypothetical protein